MKCPMCGETLVLAVCKNADVVMEVDPETRTIVAAGLSILDNVDYETLCCRNEATDEMIAMLNGIEYDISDAVDVIQTAGRVA